MPDPVNRELLAAGGVLWRRPAGSDGIEIAVVHRPRYDDWTLPKGKPEPGEPLVVTARREVREETGYDAPLGRPLGTAEYPVLAGRKKVRYWAIEALPRSGPATGLADPAEVDGLRWRPVGAALQLLTHAHDRAVLARLVARPVTTTPVLLVRHAHAGQRSQWRGNDRDRPLDVRGHEQAARIAAFAPAFGPTRVYAADLARCVQTAGAFATAAGLDVESDSRLSDDSHAAAAESTVARVRAIAAAGPSLVVSQGDAIPAVVAALAREDDVRLPSGNEKVPARKGSIWVLSFAGDRLVDLEYYADAEPALAEG